MIKEFVLVFTFLSGGQPVTNTMYAETDDPNCADVEAQVEGVGADLAARYEIPIQPLTLCMSREAFEELQEGE
jgi:hypothetical protein